MILVVHLLALTLLALHASDVIWQPGGHAFVIIVCLLSVWRGGFGLAHLVRALVYRWHRFPRLREAADGLGDGGQADHVYIVVKSARIRPETTARVFQAALAEAGRYGAPTTLVALVAEEAERRLIKQTFAAAAPPPEIRLVFVAHAGRAGNKGLAAALRAVSRTIPADDAAVVVVDGRVLLGAGTLARSLPFLRLLPEGRGATTAWESVTDGGLLVRAAGARSAAEHHRLACSLALSGLPIPTSGRLSIHRAAELANPEAILAIEQGTARLGVDMLYLADVRALTVGQPARRRARKPGALARLSSPPVSAGVEADGRAATGFAWWCLVERRVGPWTPPIGLAVALLFAVWSSPAFLFAYGLWVGVITLARSAAFFLIRFRFNGLWLVSIVIDELVNAVAGPWAAATDGRGPADTGGITRTAATPRARPGFRLTACLPGLALGILIVALAVAGGILPLPSIGAVAAVF